MRKIFLFIMLVSVVSTNAQDVMKGSYAILPQQQPILNKAQITDSMPSRKWFVSKYIGMSTSMGFFNGGNATVLAVPVGIQLNRKLSNNWYAFAGVSAAPAYVNFNRSFSSASNNKFSTNNNFLQSNKLNMYSRAELGLMYVNDQKTFSISGSIGVERSTYPLLFYNQIGVARPNAFIGGPMR
jgi:hypothetical protein